MNHIGKRLNAARKARGLTQDQLAAQMNVSRSTISHLENDQAEPDLDSLRRLSALLGENLLDGAREDVSGEVQGALERVQNALGGMQEALAGSQAAQEAPAPDASPKPSGRRRWMLLCLAAAVLIGAL